MEEGKIATCPTCGSQQVTSQNWQTIMVNTGEHWCHSMKCNDSDSPSHCLNCDWSGELKDLTLIDDPKVKAKEAKERAQYEKLKAKFEVK